jgi:hypothetical protein
MIDVTRGIPCNITVNIVTLVKLEDIDSPQRLITLVSLRLGDLLTRVFDDTGPLRNILPGEDPSAVDARMADSDVGA